MANTGYVITTLLKKVTDDINEYPLDVNGNLCSVTGLPQDIKSNNISDPDYIAPYINTELCPTDIECDIVIDLDIESESSTTATVTANPIGGVAPYTYLWSNGQTTQTATGLLKTTEYTLTVTDSLNCSESIAFTPNVEILSGLTMEVMYFNNASSDPNDQFNDRPPSIIGTHTCNAARFNVLANSIIQGDANMNNADGTVEPDIDAVNRPPSYPDYSNPSLVDRYWGKTLSGADAAEIADETGKVIITLVYTGTGTPHSSAIWLRFKKLDGTILLSTTVDSFTSYEFDPYI